MSRIKNDPEAVETENRPSDATGHLRQRASEVGQNIRDIGSNIRDMGGDVRDVAREQVSHIKDKASDYYQQGREKARRWENSFEGYVQEQPVKSLLLAAGVGFVLALLWRRR
jgi:ElaB/YqjD/DUF883 family membrane-anchored ribosome-binding protein